MFLGDTVFAWHLERLAAEGFVKKEKLWSLRERGEEVLAGKADAWAQPRRARWLGGHEVTDGRLPWDLRLARLVRA